MHHMLKGELNKSPVDTSALGKSATKLGTWQIVPYKLAN